MSHNYLNKNRTQELVNTIKGYLSNITTVLTNLASGDARDSTKVSLSGDNVTGDIDFYDSGVGFYPASGHLNGIHGAGGTMWVAFNDAGDTMYVGNLGSNAKLITIDSTGIYINGYKIATLNDIPSAAVSGVKGNTETDYRTGNVNITAANIGAVRYDTSSQGLTSTQKSNARTNLGLGSAATSPSSSFATATQGNYATDFNSNFKPIFTTSGQSHASVFRGKYLGSSFTSAQKTAIANGTFDDLYVGDYWTINGINWRIADIDYFLNTGSNANPCTTHHLVIVPDSILLSSRMYETASTNPGYTNSYMKTQTLKADTSTASDTSTVYGKICNAFGQSYILSHQELLCNAANGQATGWAFTNTLVDIMTEQMLVGSRVVSSGIVTGDYYDAGFANTQFALFRLSKQALITKSDRNNYWTRDIRSSTNCIVFYYPGYLVGDSATSVYGVRPYFCLKGA